MATIKDVAELAGVSVGTVSNVINGKTNNLDLIEKVELAIKELGFRPNVKGRILKMTQSNLIGVLVSNLENRNLHNMVSAIEREVGSLGYSIIVKTTGNNEIIENKQIEYFLQLGVDGIIVNTSIHNKTWYKRAYEANVPVVFMEKPVYIENNMDIIQANYESAMMDCFHWLKDHKLNHIGIIAENGMMSEKTTRSSAMMLDLDVNIQMLGDESEENGFKAACEMLADYSNIELFIAGSYHLACGIKKAIDVLCIGKKIELVCIKADNWIENDDVYVGTIHISAFEIGRKAARHIIKKISQGNNQQTEVNIIEAVFKENNPAFCLKEIPIPEKKSAIRVAVLDAPITKALHRISKVYERESGIHVKYVRMSYHQLWEVLSNPVQMELFDIDAVMYDIIWKEILVSKGHLEDITHLKKEHPPYFNGFIDDSVERFGMHRGKLYGLPFIPGTQLLFYQKDLFEDSLQKIQFQRKYGRELDVPKTWAEFNTVAEFFTRSRNKNSPVKYGTSFINKGNLYNSIEFLNRLWPYNGKIISNNQVTFHNQLTELALAEYRQSFYYSKPNAEIEEWEDIAEAFKTGDVAMVNLYDSFAYGINDSRESKVAGNVGSAMIPGGCSVLGGWSLGIYRESKRKEEALKFILWACGAKTAEPFSILSGTSNQKKYYQDKESDSLYPWKSKVLDCYRTSKVRSIIENISNPDLNIYFYDELMGVEIGKVVRFETNIEDAMKTVQNEASLLFMEKEEVENSKKE